MRWMGVPKFGQCFSSGDRLLSFKEEGQFARGEVFIELEETFKLVGEIVSGF